MAFGLTLSDLVTLEPSVFLLEFFLVVVVVVFLGMVSVDFIFCLSGPIFIFDLFSIQSDFSR